MLAGVFLYIHCANDRTSHMEPVATKEQPSTFQRLKDNLPIVSVGLLVIGTVNLMMYYLYFKINILEYLDFTEVLQLQFKLFAMAVGGIVLQIAYGVWCHRLVNGTSPAAKRKDRMQASARRRRFEEYQAKQATAAKATKKRTKRQQFFRRHRLAFWLLILLVVFYVLGMIVLYYPTSLIIFLFLSIPVFFVIVVLTYEEVKKDDVEAGGKADELERKFGLYKSASIAIILIYISCIAALISAVSSVSEKSSYEVTVVMDGKTLTTNQDYRYLGRTKNYIFFYTISKKQAEIYQVSAVKTMLVSDGIDYSHAEEKHLKQEAEFFNNIIDWIKRQVNNIQNPKAK